MLWRHRRARRHGRFDQAQPVSGVRPVLDDPDSDGTAARLLAVVRPDDMDAHSAPPFRVEYAHTIVASYADVQLSRLCERTLACCLAYAEIPRLHLAAAFPAPRARNDRTHGAPIGRR